MVLIPGGHVRITGDDGKVTDITAHTIRITPLEDPVQATTDQTPPKTRPTKAAMAQLEAELANERHRTARYSADLEAMTQERDEWRAVKITDAEAEAISGCVRALDELTGRNRRGNTDYAAMAPAWGPSHVDHPVTTPVGRVLIHLAQRYGVDLAPHPPPAIDPEEPVTVTVPRRVAESLHHSSLYG